MAKEEKNLGGRPPIHTDPNQVALLIKDYYEYIEGDFEEVTVNKKDEHGEPYQETTRKWTRHPEPPTVTGLALHLGFCNKSSLYDYAEKDGFSNPIKKAISRIEKYHEIKVAYGDKCVGNIFVLKNFGWKDSQSIDHTSKGESVSTPPVWQVVDASKK